MSETLAARLAATGPHAVRRLAVLAVLTSACLWGLSGTAAEVLFQHLGVSPGWLVGVRMLGSGLILSIILRPRIDPRRDLLPLAVFGVLGLGLVQFAYFTAIAVSNVATATFLQYLAPALVAAWQFSTGRLEPSWRLGGGVILAVAGTTVIALAGKGADISAQALIWGLGSALAAAFYTLYPAHLMRRIGPWPTACYGFLLGGVAFAVLTPPWQGAPSTPFTWLLVAAVVVGGTLIPFGLYLWGVSRLVATEAAVIATAEAAAAALAGAFLLGQVLPAQAYLGGLLVVVAVLLVSLARARPTPPPELPIGGPP